MKTVVGAIMLNEPPEFIERWTKSALDSDYRVLVDTGSTNDAVECAKDLGVTVHEITVRPWRFDVARNAMLALFPGDADLVLKLDVDEILIPGWREALEAAPPANRYTYDFIWNFTPEGEPDIHFAGDSIHSRDGWLWRHPVHEQMYWVGEGPSPTPVYVPGLRIEHHADPNKSRGQYLPLLARAVKEDPMNDRMAHYYARELFFRGDWVGARAEFMRHLALPTSLWAAERAQSYRYLAKMDDYPERWLLKAAAEASDRREPWVDLAYLAQLQGNHVQAAGYAARALSITNRSGDYISDGIAWDDDALRKIAEG